MQPHELLLGRESTSASTFGFEPQPPSFSSNAPITYSGDAPVCVIAPTGSGKGRDFLCPNLLTYPGPVIALDPKGELSAICGPARRAMGHRIVILDPFKIASLISDRLNPLDLMAKEGPDVDTDAEMIASLLSEGHTFKSDPFWSDTGRGIVSGLIAYIAARKPPDQRNLNSLRSFLYDRDLTYELAVILDADEKERKLSQLIRDEFIGFIGHPDQQTRPSVLSTATSFIKALGSENVARCLENSTFDLADIAAGKPVDVFITIPPDRLNSHGSLIRLWIGTLMTAVMRRRVIPEQKTLFVLDEAAQLGTFSPLLTATTLLRGYGLQVVSVWQDLAQLKTHYPKEWETILNNSGAVLAFGFAHYGSAKGYSDVLGIEARELVSMMPDEAALAIRGEGIRKIRRMNYLNDPGLNALADKNPYFDKRKVHAVSKKPSWVEKLDSARKIIRAEREKDQGDPKHGAADDSMYQMLFDMADAIEEIGRMAERGHPVREDVGRGA